ncbi:MAG: gamma-glutamylcyclotransferase [Bradyrhizobiaceae bacterium]|nr:MAG: gamma-glutamylcyclotransferase [Bradyrhizobiaceae bacterium]
MHRVFVYGTLKRGGERNDLLKAAAFAGKASTVASFRMLDGPYPVLRDNNGPGPGDHPVSGEVFEVDDAALAALDDYEGVGERLYDRIETDVAMEDGRILRAFIYVGCAGHWDREPHKLYARLDANGHLDWQPSRTRDADH